MPTQSEVASVAQLKRFIASELPDYMTPSAIVTIDQLPLTPSGKLDRRALPEPDERCLLNDETYVAPRPPIERELAEIWADVLGVDRVGIRDSFLELGGHSLLATHLISRVRDCLHVEIAFRELFEAPTVCEMSILVVERQATSLDLRQLLSELTPEQRAQFEARVKNKIAMHAADNGARRGGKGQRERGSELGDELTEL